MEKKEVCGTEWGVVHYGRPDLFFGVANSGSRFVAVGTDVVLVSDDGLNWSRGTPCRRTTEFAVTYGERKFVAVGDRNYIATSTNGIDWVERRFIKSGAGALWGVTHGGGTFIAVGEKGQVLTSPNAITWKKRKSGISKRLQAIAYGDGKFVAAGVDGKLYLSTDLGVSWSKKGAAAKGLMSVTYGNGRFVAGGRDGTLYTSDDGAAWKKRDPGVTTFFRGLTYSSSAGFVAVGNRGPKGYCMIMTSPDGINWKWRHSYVTSEFMDVTANNDMVVAVAFSFISVSMCNPPESGQLVLASPNGGEVWDQESSRTIRWGSFGTVGKVKLEYSTDNGGSWTTIIRSTGNDGLHPWKVPGEPSSQSLVRVSEAGDGGPVDTSNNTFTIKSDSNTITLKSPNGGEQWEAGSCQNITWIGSVSFSKVDIEYYDGSTWKPVVTGTADDGTYEWTVPGTANPRAKIRIKGYDGGTNPTDCSERTFTILNKITLTAPNGGETLKPETEYPIKWEGSVLFNKIDIEYYDGSKWNVIENGIKDERGHNWKVPEISTSEAKIWIKGYDGSTNPTDYSDDTFSIGIYPEKGFWDEMPIGGFDMPEDGVRGVNGSIAVSGWALDDTGVESVKIYREVNGDFLFLGDAVFVEGTRPDVEQKYPGYPNNSRAGWGYMLLSNLLPDGQLILKAIATNTTGHQVVLGTKTVFVDNADAVKPFGAIDTPGLGCEVSGTKSRNSGWVLTPRPNKIPENGSTIEVLIDDQSVGKANYNIYRKDIAQLFPGFANSDGARAYFDFDTTVYSNGVHTISWSVTDSAGNTTIIGPGYFTIRNTRG